MNRKAAAAAGVFLAAAVAVSLLGPRLAPLVRRAGGNEAGVDAGPRVVLRGVALREEREKGGAVRILADEAVYSVGRRTVTGHGVTLFFPAARGEVVARAPRVAWDLSAGRIVLPGGGLAEAPGGWSAWVAAARIDLGAALFEGEGPARIDGPGIAVKGSRLTWRVREGTISVERPSSRIEGGDRRGGKG